MNEDDDSDSSDGNQAASVTDESDLDQPLCRSGRSTAQPERLTYPVNNQQVGQPKSVKFEDEAQAELEQLHNLNFDPSKGKTLEYTEKNALIAAMVMIHMNQKATEQGASFAQQYLLQKGLKVFGKKGEQAAAKELDQLHNRDVFGPILVSELTEEEKRKAPGSLMFLSEKRDGTIKGRMVYNGKPTRQWISRDDAASPTVSLNSIMVLAAIDAKENHDVMTADVPNAFVQTQMPQTKDGEERVIMKIT